MTNALHRLQILSSLENKTKDLDVSYSVYCAVLDNMVRPADQQVAFEFGLPAGLLTAFKDLKAQLTEIADEFKVGISDVVKAFKQRDIFALLKGLSFNVKAIWKSITAFTSLVPKGLFKVFETLIKSGALDKLRAGTMKIDEVLHSHPLLTRLGGIALAGFLLWVWLSMSFTGSPQFDLDMTSIIAAFKGNFSLTDLLLSPEGLTMLTLLGTGMFTGLGAVWLGSKVANLILALVFTGARNLHNTGLVTKLAKHLQPRRY